MLELEVDLVSHEVLKLDALRILNEIFWQFCMPILISIYDLILHLDQKLLIQFFAATVNHCLVLVAAGHDLRICLSKGFLNLNTPVINEFFNQSRLLRELLVEFCLNSLNSLIEYALLLVCLFLIVLQPLLELCHHEEKFTFYLSELVTDILRLASAD